MAPQTKRAGSRNSSCIPYVFHMYSSYQIFNMSRIDRIRRHGAGEWNGREDERGGEKEKEEKKGMMRSGGVRGRERKGKEGRGRERTLETGFDISNFSSYGKTSITYFFDLWKNRVLECSIHRI